MLDGDFRWTKDGSDADQPGTMVILHDTTLDRVTNCSGTVSSWLQSSTRDSCSTKVGGQRLMRLVDLLRYGNSLESHSPWQSRFLRSPWHRPSSCGMRSRTPGCRCRRHRPNLLHWTRSLSWMPPIPATVSGTAWSPWEPTVGHPYQRSRKLAPLSSQAHDSGRCGAQLSRSRHQAVSVYEQERVRQRDDDRVAAVRQSWSTTWPASSVGVTPWMDPRSSYDAGPSTGSGPVPLARLQPHICGNDQSDADEDGNQYQAPRVVRKCSLGGGSSCHGEFSICSCRISLARRGGLSPRTRW